MPSSPALNTINNRSNRIHGQIIEPKKYKFASTYLLQRHEHDDVPASQPCKIWEETVVEGQQPVASESLNEAVYDTLVLSVCVTCRTSTRNPSNTPELFERAQKATQIKRTTAFENSATHPSFVT
jgi:hypothetical protein